MEDRIKILPAVILTAGLLLGVKAIGLFAGSSQILSPVNQAIASSEKKDDHGEPAAHDAPAGDHGADAKGHAQELPKLMNDQVGSHSAVQPRSSVPPTGSGYLSQSEVQVLESLTKRREALDSRAQEVEMKEKLLVATEQRVQEKISELKEIELRIESLLGARDEAEEEQIQSLVKVYENMKAKDAARILQNLDREILLSVAARMKEAKFAAILSQMDPSSAQEITVLLANRMSLPDEEKQKL